MLIMLCLERGYFDMVTISVQMEWPVFCSSDSGGKKKYFSGPITSIQALWDVEPYAYWEIYYTSPSATQLH